MGGRGGWREDRKRNVAFYRAERQGSLVFLWTRWCGRGWDQAAAALGEAECLPGLWSLKHGVSLAESLQDFPSRFLVALKAHLALTMCILRANKDSFGSQGLPKPLQAMGQGKVVMVIIASSCFRIRFYY